MADAAIRREVERQQRKTELIARRAEVAAAKRHAEAERHERQLADEAREAAERAASAAVATRAFAAYQVVREHVRRMRERRTATVVRLTAVEQQLVSALAHLADATPETVANLRRHCEPIGGVRAADYDDPSPELMLRLKRDYRVLRRQAGAELFVPESTALGGFGLRRDGQLVNADTLKYFSVLVALQDAAVLGTLRGASRCLVWEIGGGWGGFAYQFKTICPNSTYLITGLPEQLLVSATYLMTVFPGARCRFFTDADARDLWAEWADIDFVFAPESALDELMPPRVELTLDLMALGRMHDERVRRHVRQAFDYGCRYFYALLPAAGEGDDASRVRAHIERSYWPHPVPPRAEHIPPVSDDAHASVPDVEYLHLVGWRRLHA